MKVKADDKVLFYLNLSDKLTKNFLVISQFFKAKGMTLVPLRPSDLLQFTREAERIHLICIISGLKEKERFQRKLKKYLNLMIQNNVVDLYIISSFSNIDQTAKFRAKKNYHFVSLPIEGKILCDTICTTVEIKEKQKLTWPGGKGPRPNMLNQL